MFVFLFTDIEGSTRLWEEHTKHMSTVIVRHDEILQEQIEAHGGRITKHTGDGVTAAFENGEPVASALQTQVRFSAESWAPLEELRIRVGLHAGEAEVLDGPEPGTGDYFGPPVNCTARIMSAAWGGQILLTPEVTRISELPAGASLLDLGVHLLKDVSSPQQLLQLLHPELPRQEFPPLRTLSGESIRRAVDNQGSRIADLPPPSIALALVSATLAPMLQGDLSSDSPELVSNLGILDDLGALILRRFTSEFAAQLLARQEAGQKPAMSEIRQRLEDELLERWEAGDKAALALRADVSQLLQAVHGFQAAMATAADDVKMTLARGLADLGYQFGEFRWMLAGVQDTLAEMRVLQRQHLAMTEEILQLQREQVRGPLAAYLPEAEEPPAFLEGDEELYERPIFVERQRELNRLEGFLDQALQRQGQVVFVTGGPGRGKTALLAEFARRAMDMHHDLLVASGNCNAYSGIGDPYLPFRDAMTMLSGEAEARWEAGAISRDHARRLWAALPLVIQTLLVHGPHLIDVFVPGVDLLARAVAAAPADAPCLAQLRHRIQQPALGSETLEQAQLFQQLTNMLRALSEHHPLLLILDDLQWIDRASAGLLFHLGRRLEGAPILIAGTYRPEEVALGLEERERGDRGRHLRVAERHPLEKVLTEFKRSFGDVWLDLAEVEEPAGRRFVDAFLETEPNRLGEGFRQALFRRAGGHPLFTIELLRAMRQRGDLQQDEAGCWVEGSALDWEALPARVEGVIAERIGRLGEDPREILTVASVEGEDFTAEVVARVLATESRELVRRLSGELQKEHRLVRARGLRQLDARRLALYRFQHHQFQKYLYNSLDEAERVYLHEDVGNVLEALYGEHADAVAVQLARHFHLAGNLDREAYYARLAGEQAAARYANEEAIVHYSRALALLPEDDLAARCGLLLDRERIYNLLGDRGAQASDLDILKALAEGLGDPRKQAEVAVRQATYAEATGNYPLAIAAAEQAVALAREAGDKQCAVHGHLAWGQALERQGNYDLGRDHFTEALDLASEADLPDSAAKSLHALALIESDRGDYAAAQSFLEQGLVIIRETGDLQAESDMLNLLGLLFEAVGDCSAARVAFRQVLEISHEIGNRLVEGYVRNNLGQIDNQLGAYREAREHYEASLAIFDEIGNRMGQGAVFNNLGETARYQGDYLGARGYYEQALATFGEIGNRPFEGYALTGLGDALTGLGELDEAAAAYQQAIALRRELGQQVLAMTSRAGLAEVRLAQGDLVRAQSHVASILEHLHAGGSFEEPFRIYLTCYLVLAASQDPCAGEILETAHQLLQERAAKIPDEEARRSFLEDIPSHRQIASLWKSAVEVG